MIDFEGKRKPAWHVVRKAYAPQIVSFSNQEGVTQVVLVNDGLEIWSADLKIYKADLSGKSELIEQNQYEVKPGSHQLVKINLDLAELDPTTQFLAADAGGDRSLLFLNEDSALAYEPVKFQMGLSKAPEGIAITIKAESLLRELCIFVDRIDDGAEISDAAVTLLDGETITLIVTTSKPELFTEAAIKLATRCANEYKNPKLNK
jgi:beta-mannosidase